MNMIVLAAQPNVAGRFANRKMMQAIRFAKR